MSKQEKGKRKGSDGIFKIIGLVAVLLSAFLIWYIFLPVLNIHSLGFWIYLVIISTIAVSILSIFSVKNSKFFIVPGGLLVAMLVLSIASNALFNAKAYSGLIVKQEGSFEDDIKEASFDQVPTIDRDTAIRLGSRKMGEMLDLVSQYNVSDYYTQINYKDKPVRVTPLKYNGVMKWIGNKDEGIPNYIIVDMIDGKVELAKLESNMKYSKSDKFSRNIDRHIKVSYPGDIIHEIGFEINDEGTPYWIAPVYKTNIGWFGGLDVTDVIITNAITGENTKYKVEDTPKWVDRVYDANMINKQLNWSGKLQSGFLNSLFSQKGVTMITEGYNYLAIDDDVYLYTGITSVGEDESNIGFVLVNMRTKDTKFYKISSAEEFSAMESAQGAVQEKGYISTFPILLNINNKPTYFMSLKDDGGLVKAYALVDAQNYQEVTIGKSVSDIVALHSGNEVNVNNKDDNENEITEEILNITGDILDIKVAVLGGNTHYYIIIGEDIFIANVNVSKELPFLKIGENVSLDYYNKNNLNTVTSMKLSK